jgi:hypothetical protein
MAQVVTFIVSIVLPDRLEDPEKVAQDILDNLANEEFDAPAEFGLNIRDYNGAALVPALQDAGPEPRDANNWETRAEDLAVRNSRDFVCILHRESWPN